MTNWKHRENIIQNIIQESTKVSSRGRLHSFSYSGKIGGFLGETKQISLLWGGQIKPKYDDTEMDDVFTIIIIIGSDAVAEERCSITVFNGPWHVIL